jgi:hypothetical protein
MKVIAIMLKYSIPATGNRHCVPATKTNRLNLFMEKNSVYSEKPMKFKNAFYLQKVDIPNVKVRGTTVLYSVNI